MNYLNQAFEIWYDGRSYTCPPNLCESVFYVLTTTHVVRIYSSGNYTQKRTTKLDDDDDDDDKFVSYYP